VAIVKLTRSAIGQMDLQCRSLILVLILKELGYLVCVPVDL
jgi:hypothetical protein